MNIASKKSLITIGLVFLTTLFGCIPSIYATDVFSDYFSRQPVVYTDFLSRQAQAIASGQPDPCNTTEGATYNYWCTKWSAHPTVPANAYSNPLDKSIYTSLHQYRNISLDIGYNVTTVVNSPDNQGVLRPNYTSHFYTGFRNQFNPNNQITSCGMNLLHSEGCDISPFFSPNPETNISISIPNFRRTHIYPITNDFKYKTFKIFVPAGSSNILGNFFFPQSLGKTSYAYAVHLGQPPKRSGALTAEEYVSYEYELQNFSDGSSGRISKLNNITSPNYKSFFNRLIDGDEIILTHDGGGSITFGSADKGTRKLQKGAWLYFRQLQELPNDPYITGPQIVTVVSDKQLFLDEYRNMNWQTNGDPIEELPPQDTILAPVSVTLSSNTSFYLTTSSLATPGDVKQIIAQNGKVILTWKSQGMTLCTLNGEDIGLSGEKTITGLTTDGIKHYYKCMNTITGKSASMYFTIFNNSIQDCSAPGSCGQGLPPSNPYASSLSAVNIKVLTTWITKNITSKESILTSTKYNTFIEGVIAKFKNLTKSTKNKNNLIKINYIIFELQQIQNNIDENDSSFLNDIFAN